MYNITEIADKAEIIVNGYAFTKDVSNIRVLNLNKPQKAVLLRDNGEVLATSMDDIELDIVLDYYRRNKKYMEDNIQSMEIFMSKYVKNVNWLLHCINKVK